MKRLLERIREILRNRHNRRAWTRIISVIACLVVFFSTYALILPAITMEKTAYCGIEAHQHDDSCYSEELICTIPESEGHTHDDSCYTTHDELSCQLEEHVHGEGCYDEEGNLICELIEHEHDSSCWQEVTELTCGLEESEGHHHTDACYEKVLTCGKETHTHSEACYELNGPEAAGTAATDARGVVIGGDNSGKPADDKTAEVDVSTVGETDPNAATDSAAVGLTTGAAADPDAYVPTLGELDFNRILNRNTGIYYYHVETAEDAAENQEDAENIGEEDKNQGNDQAGEQAKSHPEEINSADIPADAWQKVNKKTVLGENDILRVYFSYTIPAGSLNETNDIARYRLPANLHINDDQIKAINKTENGIAAAFIDYDTLAITDADAYHKYLGVEAVEGTRRPGEIPAPDAQEYISAVVRVENVYDTEGFYGEKDAFLGQDLVFTFVPYTVQTNQNTYDAQGNPTSAGETVKGWFTMDLTIDQIDFQPTSSADSSSDSSDPTSGTREAEIVFVEKYKDPAQGIEIDEISTKLVLKDMSGQDIQEQDDSAEDADNPENAENPEQAENVDDADNSEPVGEAADESDKEASAEGDADEANYPAQSFKDSITVRMGSLSTDTNAANAMNASNAENTSTAGEGAASAAAPDIQNRTELTVSVEAEEGTFPEGTTMHLAPVTGSDLDTVAEAVEGAVESRTAGFHAVDITFRDADGNENEPRKPIKVSMQSESIRQAVENPSTAPVVVHVEDNKKENEKGNLAGNENVNGDGSEADHEDEITAETDSSSSSSSNIGLDSVTVTGTTVPGSAEEDNLTFEADSFSIYAVVYTVDFHWEVNGKVYEFSIPGGGFVSLEHIVEVLGIALADENTENEAENAENGTQKGDDPAGEVPGADESGENGKNGEGRADETAVGEAGQSADSTAFEEAVKLNEVDVSEAAKKFAADVESVEFSSPELVWVGKVDSAATVGGLKETNGLKVEYSAELTEEQIAEINNSTIEAGDWALISMQPFTSEESLTVTMKNGDQFAVKVTDAQISTHVITADGKDFIITVTYGPEAGIPDGAKLEAEEIPEGTEEYQSYLERAVSAARLESAESISFVRFFDINILADGEELEPIAPVRVSVTYANSVDVPDGRQLAVHFADSGVEVLDAKAEKAEATAANTFVFEQSSFSVTGTLVENGIIESGAQYMIVYSMSGADVKYYNNGSWHSIGDAGTTYYFALAGDGTTKALVYDPTTGVFSYVKDDYVSWTFNRNSNGAYTVYNADSGNYLNMGDANSLVRNSANNNILVENQYNGRFKIRNNANAWTYSNRTLAWNINYPNNSSRGGVNYTVNASPIDVMLVKVDDEVPSYPSYDGYETGDDFDTDVLQDWLDELEESDEAITSYSKTAQCVDYDDRIYRVDLNAASGKHAFDGVMDLSFILDVSPSMFFPADLEPVTSNPIAINTTNLNNLAGNTNSPVVFYVISDPENTSTNYAFYRNSRYGGWTYCDASTLSVNSSGQYTSSNPNPNISGGAQGSIPNTGNMVLRDGANVNYTVYQAVEYQGAERQRMYYLQSNMNAAIDVLKELAIFTGDTDSNISYVTFGKVPRNWGTAKVKDGITLNYQTEGGTRQDLALAKALELGYFNTDSSRTKYAILITDGAPVHTSSTVPAEYIDNEILRYANELKATGVKLITVGLSTHDVPNGKFILHEVADSIGDKLMFYEAENGNELQYVLRDILETILAKASVTGTVTDTIDEAFYPVDAQGNPLQVGDTITVDNVTGVIGKSGNNYTVTWGNSSSPVEFPWDIEEDNTKNGWTGSFYIKSKEDFLGGNDINTNKDATITADKFLVRNSDGTIVVGPKDLGTPTIISGTDSHIASGTNKLPSPVVNVDDLVMTDQSTTWTVYRGTDVDPKDEIERIYNAIKINEVVTETRDDDENGLPDHVIRTDSGENIGGTGGTPEQFCLKDIPGLETLDWSRALNPNGYTVDYNKYGHAAGKIRVVVEVLEGVVSDLTGTQPHEADTVRAPAEKYRLTVSYEPNEETIPYAQSHITENEEKGSAISTSSYQNDHTINVIAKNLEVTKVGPNGETVLRDLPAKFTLYKESVNGTSVEGLPSDKKYEAVEVTTSNGVASWEYLEPAKAATGSTTYWKPETIFYIKETQPPTDYAAYPDFITVKLNITETTPIIGSMGSEPYDTTQTATVTIIGDTVEAGHEDEAYIKVTSTEGNTVKFTVKNDLPTDITLKKIDKTTRENIPGAKFSLKKGYAYADLSKLKIVNLDSDGNPTTTAATIETIHRTNPTEDVDVIVVPATGIKISGLTNGDYTLQEEVAPDGYIITDPGTTFTATNGSIDKEDAETGFTFVVENEPGAALPNTGGRGTNMLYLLGIMLTGLAGAGLVMKRRRRNAA